VEEISNTTRELKTKRRNSLSGPHEIKRKADVQVAQPRLERLMRRGE